MTNLRTPAHAEIEPHERPAAAVAASPSCATYNSCVAASRPSARGWIHFYSAFVALLCGLALVICSRSSTDLLIGSVIYVATFVLMFGVSALYHIKTWRNPDHRLLMKRLDHCSIFLFIAGTYTFFITGGIPDKTAKSSVLIVMWSLATLGTIMNLFWPHHPRSISVPIYLIMGWIFIFICQRFKITRHQTTVLVLLTVGGLLYSGGAVCYAISRPNPSLKHFGYHEVFHSFVSAAAFTHHVAAWIVLIWR